RAHYLRIWRSLRMAYSKLCPKIPRRICVARPKTRSPTTPAGVHTRRINQRRIDSHRPHRPRPRLGKSRCERNHLNTNLETRKPGMELQNKHLTERIISAAIRVHKELDR